MISPAQLDQLPPDVERPSYDRSSLTVGIVHLGVGGFHRSHQAMYLDRLLQAGGAAEWAICGVGLMPMDARMRDVLRAQDHLYTLVLKHPDGQQSARVVGAIVDYLFAPDDPEAVIERMANPATRIVTLTITEGGYNLSEATGEFRSEAPAVLADLADPSHPGTAFALVVEALRRRRERCVPPFAVLSCDNIQSNGAVARHAFSSFAALRDPELGDFVRESVAFPSSMVDRITPQTTDSDRADLESRLGITDAWPVVAEPFAQWVIEDDFPLGRPEWELVGAQIVADVLPYEQMKLRLLNASHQALGYFGSLLGYRYVHEAVADPLIVGLLGRYWQEEGIPSLTQDVPGIDLLEYSESLLQRYLNPAIRDTLARLCAETSDRIPKFLLPAVSDLLDVGRPVPVSAAVVASWARYAEGIDENGEPIEVVDRRRDEVMAAAARQTSEPAAFLSNAEIFGDLATREAFMEPYVRALTLLRTHGARVALTQLLAPETV